MFRPRYLNPTLDVEKEANAKNKMTLREISKVLAHATRPTNQRNDKIHNLWGVDTETGKAVRASTKKAFTTNETSKLVPIEELERLITDLRSTIDESRRVIVAVKAKKLEEKWWLKPKEDA